MASQTDLAGDSLPCLEGDWDDFIDYSCKKSKTHSASIEAENELGN